MKMIKIQTIPQQKEFAQFLQLNRSEIHLEVNFVNSDDLKLFQEYQMYISKFKSMFGDVTLSRSTNEDLTQSQSPSRHELQQSNISNNASMKNRNQQNESKREQNLDVGQQVLSSEFYPQNSQDQDSEAELKCFYNEGDSLKDGQSILGDETTQTQNDPQEKLKPQPTQTNGTISIETPKETKKYQNEEFYQFESEIKEKAVFQYYQTDLDNLLIDDDIKFAKKDKKYVLSYNIAQLKQNLMNFIASIQIDSVFIDEISIIAHQLSPKYQKALKQRKIYTLSMNNQLFLISRENRDLKELLKRYKRYRGIILYFNTLSPIGDAVNEIENGLMINRERYFQSQCSQKFNFNFIESIEYVLTDVSHAVLIHMNFVETERLQTRDFENAQQYMMDLIQTYLRNLFYCQFNLQSEINQSQFQKFGQLMMQKQEKQQVSIRCESNQISLLGEKGDILELFEMMKRECFKSDLVESVYVIVKIQHNSLQEVVKDLSKMKCDITNIENDFLGIQPRSADDLFVYLKVLAQKHMAEEEQIYKYVNQLNKYNLNEKGEPMSSFCVSSINFSNTHESSVSLDSGIQKNLLINNIQIKQSQIDQSSMLSSTSKLQDQTIEMKSDNVEDIKANCSYENPRNEILFDLENYQQPQNIESNQLLQIMRQFTTNQLVLRVPYVSQQYRNYFHSLGIHKPIKIYFVTRNNRKYTSFPSNMVFYKNEVAAKNKFLSEKFYVLVEMLVYPKAKFRELKENPNQMCFKESNQVCPNIALYQI